MTSTEAASAELRDLLVPGGALPALTSCAAGASVAARRRLPAISHAATRDEMVTVRSTVGSPDP